MAVPSRKKCISRVKRGRSAKNLALKKRILNNPITFCYKCKKEKLLHHACLNCFFKNAKKK